MGTLKPVISSRKEPIISVILPIYNVDQYLEKCLDSIVGQTVRDIEIICVNDCSQDNSQKILDEYASKDSRFVIIQQELNQGQGEARNVGIDRALGKYIFFIDPDDLFNSPDSLEHLLSIAEENQDDMVVGSTLCFSEQKEDTWPLFPDILCRDIKSTTLDETPSLINLNNVWNRLIRADLLRKNNVRFIPPRYGEDVSFSMASSFYAQSISITKQYTMRYRGSGNYNRATPQKVQNAREHTLVQFEFLKQNGSHQLLDQMKIKILNTLEFRHRRAITAGMDINSQIKELEVWHTVIKAFPEELFTHLSAFQHKYCGYIKKGDHEQAIRYLSPRVSVIIPVYNVEKYLGQCLDSIISQTLRDIEIICVNDASPDDSQSILNEYAGCDSRIVLLEHEKNRGLSGARNTGLVAAKGDYIYFIDSDDFLACSDALEILYNGAITDDADEVIGGVLKWCENTGEKYLDWHENYLKEEVHGQPLKKLPQLWANVIAANKLLRRSFLAKHNIRFNEYLRKHEDNPFSVQVHILASRISIILKTTYIYRQAQASSIMSTVKKSDSQQRSAYCYDIFTFIEADKSRHVFRKMYYPGYSRQLIAGAEILSCFSPSEEEKYTLLNQWTKIIDLLPEKYPEIPPGPRDVFELIKNKEFPEAWNKALEFGRNKKAKEKELGLKKTELPQVPLPAKREQWWVAFREDWIGATAGNGQQPSVSIIIPVFNVEQYLAECLESIIHQTLRDIEIICVNDASPDNSHSILNEYAGRDQRIVLLQHEKNKGLAATRNTGLAAATGDYIYFIDSDDFLACRDALEILYNAAITDDADEVVGGILKWYEGTGENRLDWHENYLKEEVRGQSLKELPQLWSNVIGVNKLLRRSFLKEQGIHFNEKIRKHEDHPFSIQVHILAKKISILPQTTYIYRQVENGSIMSTVKKTDAYFKFAYCYDIFKFIEADKSRHIFRKMYYPMTAGDLIGGAEVLSRFLPSEDDKNVLLNQWSKIVSLLPVSFPEIPPRHQEVFKYIKKGKMQKAWDQALVFAKQRANERVQAKARTNSNAPPKSPRRQDSIQKTKQLNTELAKLKGLNETLSGQIEAVFSSYSWRITAPLRHALIKLRGY